ncbi:ABC transporter ATP-binding protein [Verrucomicrobiota bacterium]
MNLIELRGISKAYNTGGNVVHAVRPIDLIIEKGKFVAIMGPSGSGKSTLLNLLGMLDRPTSGEYLLQNVNIADLNDDEMSEIRCLKIGIVFQSFNLFPQFTVLENVCVPMWYANIKPRVMLERAKELLEILGLTDRIHHRPNQLSGGQSQRVAIARALANDPPLILADEPTGNLDEHTGSEVMEIFHGIVTQGRTVVMVTHNPEYSNEAERIISLHDGAIVQS